MKYVLEREGSFASYFLTSKFLLYAAVLVLVLRILIVTFYLPLPGNLFFADITRTTLTALLNNQRQQLGLPGLTENEKLNRAAVLKAQDMVAGGYFAHQSPQGKTPWHWFGQVGYNYAYAGENLAVGFIDSPEVFNAWLNSPSHKANMVNSRYTEVGTAVVPGFEGNSVVVVQLFGSPKAVKPAPKPIALPSESPEPLIVTNAPAEGQDERVLPAATQSSSLESPNGQISMSPYVKWLNVIIYGNNEYLQYAAYLLLATVALSLFILIAAEFKFQRTLAMRSLVIVVILSLSLLVDKNFLVHIIPHQLLI